MYTKASQNIHVHMHDTVNTYTSRSGTVVPSRSRPVPVQFPSRRKHTCLTSFTYPYIYTSRPVPVQFPSSPGPVQFPSSPGPVQFKHLEPALANYSDGKYDGTQYMVPARRSRPVPSRPEAAPGQRPGRTPAPTGRVAVYSRSGRDRPCTRCSNPGPGRTGTVPQAILYIRIVRI
jgi:hypothetical protein